VVNKWHLAALKDGAPEWNRMRPDYFSRYIIPEVGAMAGDLPMEEQFKAMGEYIEKPDLRGMPNHPLLDLSDYDLSRADLREADLHRMRLAGASLVYADLRGADLTAANLREANLRGANLAGADLRGAALGWASLVNANVEGARFTGAEVYGLSAWGLRGSPADERDLIITPKGETLATADNLRVAQFIYLMMTSSEIRGIIDTIASKTVLILGRFSAERKPVLDAVKAEIRLHNYVPVVFDFEGPRSRDTTESVSLLAGMARFVIADLTDPRSVPQELQAIAPATAVPIQPVIAAGHEPWSMFADLRRKYHWVLEPHVYEDADDLVDRISTVIASAEKKRAELSAR
jgi:hypothetical protein